MSVLHRPVTIPHRLKKFLSFAALAILLAAAISSAAFPADSYTHPSRTNFGQSINVGQLIEAIQRKYSRMQGLSANFTQLYVGADGRAIRESGTVLLKRPRKARWDYSAPERKVFIADGKTVYFYVYGEREATKAPIKESVDPQIPFLFLLSSANIRKEFSRIESVSSPQAAIGGDVVLHLVPKRAPEEFKSMFAEVDPKTLSVRRLMVTRRNGATMDFLLSNVRENYVAPDKEFSFSAPPGVIVRRAQEE